MEKQNLIITIGRQYGSGGAEVGKKLGQRMGLDVHDRFGIGRVNERNNTSL